MNLKLNQKRTYLVCFAFMSIMLFWTVYDLLIAKMLVDNFGLGQTASGFVMALDNILALFLLPLFGKISDKTRTKYGKRTPFIIIGTLIAAILFVGVAFFDLAQQLAVTKFGYSEILFDELTNVFYYTKDGNLVTGTLKVTGNLVNIPNIVKSYVAEHRAASIFSDITMKSPGLLIGFIVVLFFVLLAMGIYRSPAVSLMPDVTPKP